MRGVYVLKNKLTRVQSVGRKDGGLFTGGLHLGLDDVTLPLVVVVPTALRPRGLRGSRSSVLLRDKDHGSTLENLFTLKGGRHSTAVAFKLRTPAARVQIFVFPRDIFSLDVAELIDSKDSAIKLNKLIEPIQYW